MTWLSKLKSLFGRRRAAREQRLKGGYLEMVDSGHVVRDRQRRRASAMETSDPCPVPLTLDAVQVSHHEAPGAHDSVHHGAHDSSHGYSGDGGTSVVAAHRVTGEAPTPEAAAVATPAAAVATPAAAARAAEVVVAISPATTVGSRVPMKRIHRRKLRMPPQAPRRQMRLERPGLRVTINGARYRGADAAIVCHDGYDSVEAKLLLNRTEAERLACTLHFTVLVTFENRMQYALVNGTLGFLKMRGDAAQIAIHGKASLL